MSTTTSSSFSSAVALLKWWDVRPRNPPRIRSRECECDLIFGRGIGFSRVLNWCRSIFSWHENTLMLRWNDRTTNLITGSRVTKGRGASPLPRGWPPWELTLSHCVFSIIIPFIVIKTVRNVFFAFRLNIVPRCWKHSRDSIFYVSFPAPFPPFPTHRISSISFQSEHPLSHL